MMNLGLEMQLQSVINSPQRGQMLLEYLKLLLLKHCSSERNEELKDVFESQDIQNFFVLIQEEVPDYEQKILGFIKQIV